MRKMSYHKIYHTSRIGLILFALIVGFKSLICGDIKIALKRIILPINYWRVSIFQIVSDYIINFSQNHKKINVLDIGSPKMLSLFLASRIDGLVYATDLQDKAIYTEWERHYHNLTDRNNIYFEYVNAKQTTYPDNFFEIVYSLSVIHMITPAENGDIQALLEIQKKLNEKDY